MSKQYTTDEQSEEKQRARERIIAATSRVLAKKGYDTTTLREISREAQLAPGLVHYYFGGKDQLLVEVLQAAGRRFNQAAREPGFTNVIEMDAWETTTFGSITITAVPGKRGVPEITYMLQAGDFTV